MSAGFVRISISKEGNTRRKIRLRFEDASQKIVDKTNSPDYRTNLISR